MSQTSETDTASKVNPRMPQDDLVIAGYEAARQELLERIRMRDSIARSYVAAVATIIGIEAATEAEQSILLVVPALALGAAAHIAYHNVFILAINKFFTKEIVPWFQSYKGVSRPPLWDVAGPRYQPIILVRALRLLSDLVFLVMPTLYVTTRTFDVGTGIGSRIYAFAMLGVTILVIGWSYSSMRAWDPLQSASPNEPNDSA